MNIFNIAFNTENHCYGIDLLSFENPDRALIGIRFSGIGIDIRICYVNISIW